MQGRRKPPLLVSGNLSGIIQVVSQVVGLGGPPYPGAMPPVSSFTKAIKHLRKAALAFPETREDHPWGESAFKVRNKVFLFMSEGEDLLRVTVKLPESRGLALLMPFAQPTGYGLGKSGWITASFDPSEILPLPMLLDWLEESFCAVAPKKVVTSWKAATAPALNQKRP